MATTMSTESGRRIEVLDTIAQIDAERVIATSSLAWRVTDAVPKSFWTNPTHRILDPAVKGGELLKACALRLWTGLEQNIPDEQERHAHILGTMLHGCAVDSLTGRIGRRTLYCAKDADGARSIHRFGDNEGNIRWNDGATEFLHGKQMKEIEMEFDLIIGNPPYQRGDGGHGASASPLYHEFIRKAKEMKPRHLVMIVPARWYTGGKGLEGFRQEMLADRRMEALWDFPNEHDCFPDADISGGVCYFLWSREHDGPCCITRVEGNREQKEAKPRLLDSGHGILVRREPELDVLRRVQERGEPSLARQVSSVKPFGLRTYERGLDEGDLILHHKKGESRYNRNKVVKNADAIDQWQVMVSAASGAANKVDAQGARSVLSVLKILPPGQICTETYLTIGAYETRKEAERCAQYLDTKLARYLIGITGSTQHFKPHRFRFVPDIGTEDDWTDEKLYARYDLTDADRRDIERSIKPRVQRTAE